MDSDFLDGWMEQSARVTPVSGTAPTLDTRVGTRGGGSILVKNVVAFAQNTRDEVRIQGDGTLSGALSANPGMKQTTYLASEYAVRRLTPKECERLQGMPDDWTRIPWHGKPTAECPDGPRYKAIGNSMAVPVMRWIGRRIQEVDTE